MMHQTPNQEPTFGYLSTIHLREHGYFGGYLVISLQGRPLEFHCTAPVRPSRAQEILYGPTLEPYLLGDQIGGTLLGRAKLTPQLILTDQAATLCLRGQIGTPIVQVVPVKDSSQESDMFIAVASHDDDANQCSLSDRFPTQGRRITIAERELELPRGFDSDCETVAELVEKLTRCVDLAEPFDRIHEAIREAQRLGESDRQDAHGQAA